MPKCPIACDPFELNHMLTRSASVLLSATISVLTECQNWQSWQCFQVLVDTERDLQQILQWHCSLLEDSDSSMSSPQNAHAASAVKGSSAAPQNCFRSAKHLPLNSH